MRAIVPMMMAGILLAGPVLAQAPVALTSRVFVERSLGGALTLEPAHQLVRGEKVVLLLAWTAPGKAGERGFTLTSSVPETLHFHRAGDDSAQVSVDGGASWGRLGELRIVEGLSTRMAAPQDVTHVRIRIPAAQAARGTGRVSYSAIVR
jgi:hypothetical protein